MDKFIAKAYVEKVNEEDGVLEAAIASDGYQDRDGDAIAQDGWDLKSFKKNPQLLWGHNIREYKAPIGKIKKIWFEGKGKRTKLMFRPQFDLADPFAAEIFRKYKENFLNAFSVGFIPLDGERNEDGGFDFSKAELLEISAVAVPANPRAVVTLRGAGMKTMDWDDITSEINKEKEVVPFKSTEPLPDSANWNEAEASKRVREWAKTDDGIDFKLLKQGFGWFDENKVDDLGSYKFPHHDVRGEKLVVNFRGVATSMALLLGAKGGVELSDEDRKSVYIHLVKHYKQYEKPVPEFRFVEEQVLKVLEQETKNSYEQEFMGYVKIALRSIMRELKKI